MWYKKIVVGAEDRKIYEETEEYIKANVGRQKIAEGTFHEILRKEKQKRADHNSDRIKTMRQNLNAVGLDPKVRDALNKVIPDVENLDKPDPVEISMSDEDLSSELETRASKRHKTAHPVAFPRELVNLPEFKSFEDTNKENEGLVVFARSPPSYTRASRILDFYEFKAGDFSSVVMKFNDDSVTRIHNDFVIGIAEQLMSELETMYRSGDRMPEGSNKKRKAMVRKGKPKKRARKRNA